MGLFPPSNGEVMLNGLPLQSYNLCSYRNRIGYISQDVVIFNDTIFNNITFFDEYTPQNIEKFWEIVNMVSLLSLINSLTDRENSQLGDNGILISGGQKQRISIARELYKKPDILILDEATSALDSETEDVIKNSIAQLKGKTTILIIAHRLSTIRNADCIYLLGDKNILAAGTFEELIVTSKTFKNMLTAQSF